MRGDTRGWEIWKPQGFGSWRLMMTTLVLITLTIIIMWFIHQYLEKSTMSSTVQYYHHTIAFITGALILVLVH